jgi:hypothetical protein
MKTQLLITIETAEYITPCDEENIRDGVWWAIRNKNNQDGLCEFDSKTNCIDTYTVKLVAQ